MTGHEERLLLSALGEILNLMNQAHEDAGYEIRERLVADIRAATRQTPSFLNAKGRGHG